jgi:hypothetical protein
LIGFVFAGSMRIFTGGRVDVPGFLWMYGLFGWGLGGAMFTPP